MQNRLGIQKPTKKNKRKGYDEHRIFADHICGCWMSWAWLAVRYIGAIAGGKAPPTSTCAGWKAKLNFWLASSAFRRPFAAAAAGAPPANHDMWVHMSAACNIYDVGGAGGGCSAAAGAGGVEGEFSATECVDCCRRRWLPTPGASHREMMRSRSGRASCRRHRGQCGGGEHYAKTNKTKHSNWN